jgi:hypothetical protein
MKRFILFILIFTSLGTIIRAQSIDTISDCILKFRHINFIGFNNFPIPRTAFYYPNGNFFLRNGHVDSPNNEEKAFHTFVKNGNIIKKCFEKYEALFEDTSLLSIDNSFSSRINKTDSQYLDSMIEEYSFILQGLVEPKLNQVNDSNVFRVVFPCYVFSDGMFSDTPKQIYNSIRVHFREDSTILIFKSVYLDEELNFVIKDNDRIYLNKKEINNLKKTLDVLQNNNNVFYKTSIGNQRLFEFKKGGQYSLVFRSELYTEKVNDSAYYLGLYSKLLRILNKYGDKQLYQCK